MYWTTEWLCKLQIFTRQPLDLLGPIVCNYTFAKSYTIALVLRSACSQVDFKFRIANDKWQSCDDVQRNHSRCIPPRLHVQQLLTQLVRSKSAVQVDSVLVIAGKTVKSISLECKLCSEEFTDIKVQVNFLSISSLLLISIASMKGYCNWELHQSL